MVFKNCRAVQIAIALFMLIATGLYSQEICVVDRNNIIDRIENRSFPSVFGGGHPEILNLNYQRPDDIEEWEYLKVMMSHHDLFIRGIFRGLQWHYTPENIKILNVNGTPYWFYIEQKNQIFDLNPNFLFIATLFHYVRAPEIYPEDWEFWLRDENGDRIQEKGWGDGYLIDYTLPGAIDHFVQLATAIADCGLHDGIFMDWWTEDPEWDEWWEDRYHGSKVEASVEMVRRIREAVGDDFLILVNPQTSKLPRSAPYVNGAFMETIGPVKGYSRERLIEIEDALLWYENNLRYPQVNCLEGWAISSEPMYSPRNQQQARAFITLGLTHSNGYIAYSSGIVSPIHEHQYEIWEGHSEEHKAGVFHDHTRLKYWYNFYDVDLGKPIGEKSQNYNGIDGLFIREFDHGWAVYNRSGKPQTIRFESHVSGKSSGFGGTEHVIPDLDGEIYLKPNKFDLNADGVINILDLVIVANAFGENEPDLNEDGIVNILDLVIVANAF